MKTYATKMEILRKRKLNGRKVTCQSLRPQGVSQWGEQSSGVLLWLLRFFWTRTCLWHSSFNKYLLEDIFPGVQFMHQTNSRMGLLKKVFKKSAIREKCYFIFMWLCVALYLRVLHNQWDTSERHLWLRTFWNQKKLCSQSQRSINSRGSMGL